jgi:hypothetical protein
VGLVFDEQHFTRMEERFVKRTLPAVLDGVLYDSVIEVVRVIDLTWPRETSRSIREWYRGRREARVQTLPDGRQEITVRNRAPYADEIEYGTADIPPGGHVQRALRESRRFMARKVAVRTKKAWRKG